MTRLIEVFVSFETAKMLAMTEVSQMTEVASADTMADQIVASVNKLNGSGKRLGMN